MASRRSLTTITAAAGALLAALFFVPSASASVESGPPAVRTAGGPSGAVQPRHASTASHLDLADTGSVNTTPYLVGGAAFLGMGTAMLVFSRRRALVVINR
jgi:LPXTG-motif cell wall-anchored protein